jgi:hypothetical protein
VGKVVIFVKASLGDGSMPLKLIVILVSALFGFDSAGIASEINNFQSGERAIEVVELAAPCGVDVAEAMTATAIEMAERLGVACEKQNQLWTKPNRCPFQTCMGEFRNGGYTPPTIEIKIGNTPSMGSSMGMGYPGAGGSGGGGDTIYISTTLKFSLSPDPNKIICYGTLNPTVTNALLAAVTAEVAKSPVCKK